MFAQNAMVKPKTADDILDGRRQIEDLLAAWLAEWDAYCIAKGWNPRDILRPIEDALRERNAARPPSLTVASAIKRLQSMPSDAEVTALVVELVKPTSVEFNLEPMTAGNSERFAKMGKERGWKSE